jgi:hypothetical protein
MKQMYLVRRVLMCHHGFLTCFGGFQLVVGAGVVFDYGRYLFSDLSFQTTLLGAIHKILSLLLLRHKPAYRYCFTLVESDASLLGDNP